MAALLTSGPSVPPQTPALAMISCRMMAKLYTSRDSTLYTCTPLHLYLYTSALVVTTSTAGLASTSSGRQGAV